MPKSQLGVRLIARVADVLRALEGVEQGLSLGQLAKQLDLPKSTVQRIVAALEQENFVIASKPQAGVRIGPALIRIGHSVHLELAETAHPCLQELAHKTGETVDLAVLKGTEAIFIDHIEGEQMLRAVTAIGVPFPLYCNANGKAMLAAMESNALERIKKKIQPFSCTPNTFTSWKRLEEEIGKIRKTGLAYDREEHALGVCAVGTAIRCPDGEIAGISVPTPSVRFTHEKRKIETALIDCRSQLMARIGVA